MRQGEPQSASLLNLELYLRWEEQQHPKGSPRSVPKQEFNFKPEQFQENILFAANPIRLQSKQIQPSKDSCDCKQQNLAFHPKQLKQNNLWAIYP